MATESNQGSPRFRRELKLELDAWVRDGVVSEEQAQVLKDRYTLAEVDSEPNSLLLMVIYIFGALLIGLGVISFVAFNWALLPAFIKVVMLVGSMCAAHGAGYYLWRIQGNYPKLGHSLLFLGSILFGVTIFLLGQILHIPSGSVSMGLLAWTIGAIAMGLALPSSPILVFSLAISQFYFFNALDENSPACFVYPIALALIYVPYGLLHPSATVHAFGAIAFACAFMAIVGEFSESMHAVIWTAIALSTLYIGYGSFLIGRRDTWRSHGASTIGLGVLALVALVFPLSFHFVAEEASRPTGLSGSVLFWAAPLAICYVLAVPCWVFGFRDYLRNPRLRPIALTALGVLVFLPLAMMTNVSFLITIAANLSVLALSIGLALTGIRSDRRLAFWGGVMLLGVGIFSRFLEIETNLMLKALALLVSGVFIIGAGIYFEGHLRAKRKAARA